MRLTDLVHTELRRVLRHGDTAIDATAGNGHDTLLLAQLVGATGRIFAFDIQAEAIASAKHRAPMSWITWIHDGHETLQQHLPVDTWPRAVTFNLGYLPGADHTCVTKPETTIAALNAATRCLAPGGIITMILYRGHPGGPEESAEVERVVRKLCDSNFETFFHEASSGLQSAPRCLILRKRPVHASNA